MGRRVGINTARKHTTPEEALGAVIPELRVRKNWSHAEMGEKVGYSDKHLNAVELGYKSPRTGSWLLLPSSSDSAPRSSWHARNGSTPSIREGFIEIGAEKRKQPSHGASTIMPRRA